MQSSFETVVLAGLHQGLELKARQALSLDGDPRAARVLFLAVMNHRQLVKRGLVVTRSVLASGLPQSWFSPSAARDARVSGTARAGPRLR